MKTVYAVYKNADMTEGKGPDVLFCIFEKKEHAMEFIDNKPGVMGRRAKWSAEKYGDWNIQEKHIFESIKDFEQFVEQDTLKRALNKLTDEEKSAIAKYMRAGNVALYES